MYSQSVPCICTLHALYRVPCIYTVPCIMYHVHCTMYMYSVPCIYRVHCTIYRVHSTIYRVHCTILYRLHCIIYRAHCILCTLYHIIPCTLYHIIPSTLYHIPCTLYTMYTVPYTQLQYHVRASFRKGPGGGGDKGTLTAPLAKSCLPWN